MSPDIKNEMKIFRKDLFPVTHVNVFWFGAEPKNY